MTSSFNWRPLEESELLSKGRKIRTVLDTYQDIIGHNTPVRSQVLDYNEHGAFEGHGKEDVTSKVSNPPFINLTQKSDSNEKSMLIR